MEYTRHVVTAPVALDQGVARCTRLPAVLSRQGLGYLPGAVVGTGAGVPTVLEDDASLATAGRAG